MLAPSYAATLRPRRHGGFTILELLTAIVVIGVLASLILGKFADTKDKAYIAAQKNDLRTFTTAAELAVDRDGTYPATPEVLAGFRYSDHVSTFGYTTFGDGFHLLTQHAKSSTVCGVTFGAARANRITCANGATVSLSGSRSGTALTLTADVAGAAGRQTVSPSALAARFAPTVSSDAAPLPAADAALVEYVDWDFGDGSWQTTAGDQALSITHTYADAADYTVRAAVSLADGRLLLGAVTARETGAVEPAPWGAGGPTTPADGGGITDPTPNDPAPNQAPTAAFLWSPVEPLQGANVAFNALGSGDPDGDELTYAWETSEWRTATGAEAILSFTAAGPQTVQLIVTDPAGAADTLQQSVIVRSAAPTAAFVVIPDGPTVGTAVQFDATSATTPEGTTLASYAWRFGDGATSDGVSATHAYAAAGTYTVELVVTNSVGATDTLVRSVAVSIATSAGYAWGYNYYGALGDNSTANRIAPTAVVGGIDFTSVSTAGDHTCGLNGAGAAYCWGANTNGALGDGTTTQRLAPTLVAGGLSFTQLVTGWAITCGIVSGGDAYCWGANTAGQLGDGSTTQRLVPTRVSGGLQFQQLDVSQFHVCGLTTGNQAYCWGQNAYGQLGIGTYANKLVPTLVGGGHQFTTVTTGQDHSCGITTDGGALCWGQNSSGNIGDGTSGSNRVYPTAVAGTLTFGQMVAGDDYTCGLTGAGVAYCWGSNLNGRLGDGTTAAAQYSPVAVVGGHVFSQLAVGGSHSCGIRADGAAYCWGYNGHGALGDGTTTNRNQPTVVTGGRRFRSITVGLYTSAGLLAP